MAKAKISQRQEDDNKTPEQIKSDFKTALDKALLNPANKVKYKTETGTRYVTIDGVPNKIVDGVYIPLTRIS